MFAQLLINGLGMGSIYALVALGISIIYTSVGCINFAQGEFLMLSGFVVLTVVNIWQWGFGIGVVLTLIFMAVFGALFSRFIYYPLRNMAPVTFAIAAIGMSVMLRNLAIIIWDARPLFFDRPFGRITVDLFGLVRVNPQYLLAIGAMMVLMAIQHFFFNTTRVGRQMRATAQDKDVASLMGINVYRTIAFTFMYSSSLACIAGILVSPLFFVQSEMGRMIGLKAFSACIIGGLGNVQGSVLGGLTIGLVETMAAAYISSTYKDVFPFFILLTVLIFRPQGLFGEKVAEKV